MISDIGNKLTKSLDKDTKRKQGIYFTPKSIIDDIYKFVNNYININKENYKGNYNVCEPSCGSMEFITNENFNEFIKLVNIKRINCYELNDVIYNEIKNLNHINNTEIIDKIKVYNKDFLLTSSDKKYTFIFGNPPYFPLKSIEYKDKYNNLYKDYFKGKLNIYELILLHSLNKLKNNGILAFVLPIAFMSTDSVINIRKYIKDNFEILTMIENKDDFKETKYKTFSLIVRKIDNNKVVSIKDDNNNYIATIKDDNNEYIKQKVEHNKRYIYNNIFTFNSLTFNEKIKEYGEEIDINKYCYIYNGSFVWNENKNILVNIDIDNNFIVSSVGDNNNNINKHNANSKDDNYNDNNNNINSKNDNNNINIKDVNNFVVSSEGDNLNIEIDLSKLPILYYDNPNRLSYITNINKIPKNNLYDVDVIVIKRGRGNSNFIWEPRIIKYNGVNKNVFENHLIIFKPKEGYNIEDIYKFISSDGTKRYAEEYNKNGSITITNIKNNNIKIFK